MNITDGLKMFQRRESSFGMKRLGQVLVIKCMVYSRQSRKNCDKADTRDGTEEG